MLYKKIYGEFLSEVKKFSKANYWVYIAYLIIIFAVLKLDEGNIAKIIVISTLHFVSDIFIMMMFSAYSVKEYKIGTYFQIIAFILFFLLKLETGIIKGEWHYLAADPIYFFAAIKNYYLDTKQKHIKSINAGSMTLLSIVIIISFFWFNRNSNDIWTGISEYILSIGLFMFAISLTITRNELKRSYMSIISLLFMVVGSCWALYNSILLDIDEVNGLEISYALLPTTVLLFYITRLRSFNN